MQYFGCTHYPLVKEEINETLGGNIKFFDGANRLAVHLEKVLEEKDLLSKNNEKKEIEFIDTSNLKEKEERFKKYLKEV